MTPRRFRKLEHRDLSNADLRGCEFSQCDLSDALFDRADLRDAEFDRCTTTAEKSVSFEDASCQGAAFKGCVLPGATFDGAKLTGATLRGTDLTGSSLSGCALDDALLVEVTLAKANLNRASLRNTRVIDVTYLPARRMRARDFAALLWRGTPRGQTIFTAGTEMSPFIEHCAREYRLSQLEAALLRRPRHLRWPGAFLAALLGAISNYGTWLSRWLATSLLTVASFAAGYAAAGHSGWDAVYSSALTFMTAGSDTHLAHGAFLAETILGYLMLGVLISIVTTRFIDRW